MWLETSLYEHRVVKLVVATGCSGGIRQSPSLEISKGKPGVELSRMSQENESDLPGCGARRKTTHGRLFF